LGDFEDALEGLVGPVYLHVDLDVLDPSEFTSVCYSAPDGPSVQRVLDVIARVDGVVGASITEHAPPEGADDTDVVRRIGAAVISLRCRPERASGSGGDAKQPVWATTAR
jgi:arginase